MMHIEVKGAIMATDARVKSEQGKAEKALIEALGEEDALKLIANRTKRDGDKAHITLAGPQDGKKAVELVATERGVSKGEAQKIIPTLPLDEGWRAKGIGRAESGGKIAYFVVVDWPGGREFRESLGLDPSGQDFHITVGFGDSGDVHGVPKNRVLSPSNLKKEASMNTLRSKIIRLAHAQPALRPHLLPLVTKTAKSELYELLEWYFNSRKKADRTFVEAEAKAKALYERAVSDANSDRREVFDHTEFVLEDTLEKKFMHVPAVQEYFSGPDAWDREELFAKVKSGRL
jgi:hypothetical protein